MALREADAAIKQAMGYTDNKIVDLVNLINSGKIKGKIEGGKIYVDESEIPSSTRQPLAEKSNEKPNETTKTEPTLPQKSEVHLPSKPEIITRDILVTQTENFKAEAAKIKAQIDLEIVKGERDKPSVLAKKESELNELEKTLTQTQGTLDKHKLELDGRETIIVGKETELKLAEQKINVRLAQIEIEIQKKYDEKDIELIKKGSELEAVQKKVDYENAVLTNMLDVISGYENAVRPFYDELKRLIKISRGYADYHYGVGQKSKGKIEKDNFGLSNQFWNIKTTFEKILKNLTNS